MGFVVRRLNIYRLTVLMISENLLLEGKKGNNIIFSRHVFTRTENGHEFEIGSRISWDHLNVTYCVSVEWNRLFELRFNVPFNTI